MPDFIQVMTTVEQRDDGVRLAGLLVEQRLAACVQIAGPMLSVYRWQGKVAKSQEYRLTIKSRTTLFAKIEALIEAHHPYDTPELIAMPLSHCSATYQEWLQGELQDG